MMALSSLIDQPVDLLKLDVEGVETIVLQATADRLAQIKQLYLEFHGSSANPDNQLQQIVDILEQAGFTLTFKEKGQLVDFTDLSHDDPQWVIVQAQRTSAPS
jgi:hypothetical protein